MVDIAVIFGADKQRATKELKDSLDFEIKLANVLYPVNNLFFSGLTISFTFRYLYQMKNGEMLLPCTMP